MVLGFILIHPFFVMVHRQAAPTRLADPSEREALSALARTSHTPIPPAGEATEIDPENACSFRLISEIFIPQKRLI
jgi:hypothetical protein